MGEHGTGTFEMKTWDESAYYEGEGQKLTKASVTFELKGDIEGKSWVEYLMAYPDAENATYVGLQRVEGKVGGREGSFVLELRGKFENGKAGGVWSVVPGSGTGELTGLRGEGEIPPFSGSTASYTLDYSFEGEVNR